MRKFRVQSSEFRVQIRRLLFERSRERALKILIYFLLFTSIFTFLIVLPTPNSKLQTVFASHNLCHSDASPPPRADGLVATPALPATSKFRSTAGVCVVNDPATRLGPFAFGTGNIYDNLRANFYDKSKLTNKNVIPAGGSLPGSFTQNGLYRVDGDLTIGSSPTGSSGVQVIFVDGNLNINSNYTYGSTDANSGTVFVVRGGVNHTGGVYIAPNATSATVVTLIHAVIISTGVIDTGTTSSQLVINGSLVSLNDNAGQNIFFRRDLSSSNSTTPAEKVNYQPKYSVILRDLFSQTDQRWSEVAGGVNFPTPATPLPTPTPTPTPSPSPTPSPTPAAVDVDGDGYQAGPIGTTCPNGLPCDCYDLNASAHPYSPPGSAPYFTTDRGDGSFDYDCDGSATKGLNNCLTTMSASSCSNTILPGNAGYVGPTTPACGQTDYFRVCTSWSAASCVDPAADRPFSCGVTCTASGRSSWQVGEWIAVMFMDCR